MTTVAILPEPTNASEPACRAIAGGRQSVGKTAGEALDALTTQLPHEEVGTLVVVQQLRPDRFFTAQQQTRLKELVARWRAARDAGSTLPASDQAELDVLVDAELRAAGERVSAVLKGLGHELSLPPRRGTRGTPMRILSRAGSGLQFRARGGACDRVDGAACTEHGNSGAC